jgi:alpha-galactosidase
MGWNSYDNFGDAVTEAEVLANATYMKDHLLSHGWKYVVVDFRWYDPNAHGANGDPNKVLELTADQFGRLLPAPNRFPSAADGAGFRPLADKIHAMGMRFGIHVMRGVPRLAVNGNLPIEGSDYHAAAAANIKDKCAWCPDMFGASSTPAGQAYYDSILRLYASWGVDFIKVDDMSAPYRTFEIHAVRNAIDKCGRPIVLSLSPGPAPLKQADDLKANANMWRISGDFWDHWPRVREQFGRLAAWEKSEGLGHWPDADMIPLGHIGQRVEAGGKPHETRFTHDEQVTLMTLWCIARSPLMLGMNLPQNDDWTLSLFTNDAVLAVNQESENNHQVSSKKGLIAWEADVPHSGDKYVALFNTNDAPPGGTGATVEVGLGELGLSGTCRVEDLWKNQNLAGVSSSLSLEVAPHGARLLRLSGGEK